MGKLSSYVHASTLTGTELVPIVVTPGIVGGNAFITVDELAAASPLNERLASAVVNGFTDTAIQAAITASGWPANAARIHFPPGTYTFSTGVTVDAAGATSTPALYFVGPGALLTTTTASCTMFTVTDSTISITRINFVDLSFLVNAGAAAIGVLLNNAELCRFQNCTFIGSFGTAIKITGTSTYNKVVGCHFSNLARGIYLPGIAHYLTVANCDFAEGLTGSPLNWIQQDIAAGATIGVRIVGNTFYGTGATLPQVQLLQVNTATISGNNFSESDAGAVYLGTGGNADANLIEGNTFYHGGFGDDIHLHGSNRCIVSNNVFMAPQAAVTANTYANIRNADPFTTAQGSGSVITGNTSRASASEITNIVNADATCTNLVVVGNVGAAGVVAAHVTNYLKGNGEANLNDADGSWHITISPYCTAAQHTTWNTITVDTAQITNGSLQSSANQNSVLGFDVALDAGTWAIDVIGITSTNRGIITFALDGVTVGTTIDQYSASSVRNVLQTSTGVAVTVSGKKRLTLTMSTKNGSSSGYAGIVSVLTLRRTA